MTSARDPRLRASDADRDRVAELLRRHVAEGRLTMEEFHTRLDACLQARTYGELDALLADLPGPDPYADLPVPATQRAGGSSRLPAETEASPWRTALTTYVTANLVCWVIWLLTSPGSGGYWPLWVSGPWGAVLLGRALTGAPPDGARRRDRRRPPH